MSTSTVQNSIKGSKLSEDTGEVDHTYHDYSKIPSNGIADALAISSCDLFPMKLQMILSSPEYEHIASWMPHGRCWKIHRRKDFELVVLPKFFEHRKYDSFIRQVNGWAFKRITRGVDKGSYYNEVSSSQRSESPYVARGIIFLSMLTILNCFMTFF
uniref:HSF-type DNA-binding domain-containing protein n=1 Tax=Corethron hystrix TaxID=216773 RepID=A0A6U5J1W1_9STRA|mmetsp:Transcript_35212/g.81443  ORF Transcript_35212/g.81443 Transcript_35212/m.81443 type:complete len:157 (+) Transcript_35212:576-1046(+)